MTTWISTLEAAEILGVERGTACAYAAAGLIKAKRGGHANHSWLCDKASVLAFKEKRKKQPKVGNDFKAAIRTHVSESELERNRAKIADLQQMVMAGKVKPIVLARGVDRIGR